MTALRTWARQLGLGRLAFRWIHQPRSLAHDYGWRLVWRAARGEARMRRAARRLPGLPTSEAVRLDATLCFLTGTHFLHQTLFCAHSFFMRTHAACRLEFISDGSLTGGHARALRRLFPSANVRLREEADAGVAGVLPPEKFPTLHAVRKNFVLLRKLTDAMAGRRGYRLFLDSDMLFWGNPVELLERGAKAAPLYMADTTTDGYTASRAEIRHKFGVPMATGLNSGLVGLVSERIDWELLERICTFLCSTSGNKRLLEQTLWAVALGAVDALPLDTKAYRVTVDPPQWAAVQKENPTPVLLHYAWQARLPYLAGEWRRYLDSLAA